jgi:hypothetical protein
MKLKFKNFPIISKNLFSLLINSNVHISSLKFELPQDFNFLLHGFRNNIGIFDLKYIYFSLQKFLKLFLFKVKKKKIIIFVDTPDFFVKHYHYYLKNNSYFKTRYSFINSNSINLDLELINLEKYSKKIGLIFFFQNTLKSNRVFKSVKNSGFLTSGFSDINFDFNYDIPIFGNFTSQKSIFLFCSLILNWHNHSKKKETKSLKLSKTKKIITPIKKKDVIQSIKHQFSKKSIKK